VLLLTAALIPLEMGWRAVLVILAAEGLMAWLVLGGGVLAILRLCGVAKQAAPAIVQMVSRLASGLEHPAPRVWEVRCKIANALAMQLSNELVLVGPLVEILDEAELRGILAHEVAHLNEPQGARWMQAAGAGSLIAGVLTIPLMYTYGPIGAFGLLPFLFPIVVVLLGLPRKMEERADASAVAQPNVEGSYATALEKIHRYNLVPAVLSDKWETHPDLYDRMESAGVKPSFPRPDAPPMHLVRRGFFACFGTLFVSGILLKIGAHILSDDGMGGSEVAVMLSGGDPADLQALAYDHCTQHENSSGLLFAKAACEFAPEDGELRAFYACLLEMCGQDRQAKQVCREAVELVSSAEWFSEPAFVRLNELYRRLGWTKQADRWLEETRSAYSSRGQSSPVFERLIERERLYWELPQPEPSR